MDTLKNTPEPLWTELYLAKTKKHFPPEQKGSQQQMMESITVVVKIAVFTIREHNFGFVWDVMNPYI